MSTLPVNGLLLPEWVDLNRADLVEELRSVNPKWSPDSLDIDAQTEFDEFCEQRFYEERGCTREAA